MIDYTIFYKHQLSISDAWGRDEHWDLFISAYVPGERTQLVFSKVAAERKYWLLFPEYGYNLGDHPSGTVFQGPAEDEAGFIADFWDTLPPDASRARICIDITGFIRPYLIFFIRWLLEIGVRKVDAIYSEPIKYDMGDSTAFSGDIVKEIRQVKGCEGMHVPDISQDVLIIGAGYEDNLISHVAENKAKATRLQVIGFPSLRADMYQENVLRVSRADESLSGEVNDDLYRRFAPANDPFVAASVLHDLVTDWESQKGITNLYLCPLSTKAHVLGFTLFYLTELRNAPASIIFPFEKRYSQTSSKGIARIWKYTVELPQK